ncbi:hypothetical protein UPYG_G00272010 [Umbra pygmaea]|uniref:C-type lectin domain-containing protein n=1 Tax=Umbra pygmaea TaxID=75934 RepID=A0ABD0WFQ3_UMBPY
MSNAIYANTKMNKVKLNKKKIKDRMVDIYIDVEGPGDKSSEAESSMRRTRVSAVCLGLLCVLLLAGIIVLLSVYYNRTIKDHEKKCNNLSQSYSLNQTNATAERYPLQTSYNTLIKETYQLQTSYNTLIKERYQLQTSYKTLIKERYQLQTSYNTLTKERDCLQTKLTVIEQLCLNGWRYFESSLYFISTEKKTWEESRLDCQSRGADLVIINSEQEQRFLFNFKMEAWIGLTDNDQEGTWKWVDGTVLTTGYWFKSEPNNGGLGFQEDCVVMYYGKENPVQTWNDHKCGQKIKWICEKVV